MPGESVLHEDLTAPSHMPLIDLPDPDETGVSDEEEELLSDDEPIYDTRAHERLDFTIDDESQGLESKGKDQEFDSEEELDEDLLQEVQHHRRNQIADHDRRLEEKVGEHEPATASPLSAADPELSEAEENPGIYRKLDRGSCAAGTSGRGTDRKRCRDRVLYGNGESQ